MMFLIGLEICSVFGYGGERVVDKLGISWERWG
jgi:hypothetical protein